MDLKRRGLRGSTIVPEGLHKKDDPDGIGRKSGVIEERANGDHIFPAAARERDSPESSKGMFRL
jgi:hypothetical protein